MIKVNLDITLRNEVFTTHSQQAHPKYPSPNGRKQHNEPTQLPIISGHKTGCFRHLLNPPNNTLSYLLFESSAHLPPRNTQGCTHKKVINQGVKILKRLRMFTKIRSRCSLLCCLLWGNRTRIQHAATQIMCISFIHH